MSKKPRHSACLFSAHNAHNAINALQSSGVVVVVGRCKLEIEIAGSRRAAGNGRWQMTYCQAGTLSADAQSAFAALRRDPLHPTYDVASEMAHKKSKARSPRSKVRDGVYESYVNHENYMRKNWPDRGSRVVHESLTRSLPLARPSRACGFARIPFAASQAAQVDSYRNLTSFFPGNTFCTRVSANFGNFRDFKPERPILEVKIKPELSRIKLELNQIKPLSSAISKNPL